MPADTHTSTNHPSHTHQPLSTVPVYPSLTHTSTNHPLTQGDIDEDEFRAHVRTLVYDHKNVSGRFGHDGGTGDAAGTPLFRSISGGDTSISLEQLSAALLRYDPDAAPHSDRVRGFKLAALNPALTATDDFVVSLERHALAHDAVNHHFLDSMTIGSYGPDLTVVAAANFMAAYAPFTEQFTRFLRATERHMALPEHSEILSENHEEESGIYTTDDHSLMADLGLDARLLDNVTHKDLYTRCADGLRGFSGAPPLPREVAASIAEDLVAAFEAASCSPATSIGAMYFGSEYIVSTMYGKLVAALRRDPRLTPQDLDFFLLHIDMDCEHAEKMREIVAAHAQTKADRVAMLGTVDRILNARAAMYDKFLQHQFPPTGHGGTDTAQLYDAQSTNWVRKTKTCLSDFTGRPPVFDMCAPHVEGATVLDVGCGEGYAARVLVGMGAAGVTGVDISENMIAMARSNASDSEAYHVADATRLSWHMRNNPASLGVVPGADLDLGFFDLATGIFVFNYTSIAEMNKICHEVHDALKPGGHFVFSVPHPFMLSSHGSDQASDASFSFNSEGSDTSKYFSLRDRQFAGSIHCLDGQQLNVKMCFKTLSDYLEAVTRANFELVDVHEARVRPEHVADHPAFFESVKDAPLHLVFKVRKRTNPGPAVDKAGMLDAAPEKIRWTGIEYGDPLGALGMAIDADAAAELDTLVRRLVAEGLDSETYAATRADVASLPRLAAFARRARDKLLGETGCALVTGLDMDQYADFDKPNNRALMTERAKLAYYILASLIGEVDAGARGRLFDVRDAKLASSEDNVLFSVGSGEAGWHTDGASRDRAYDVIGLLCVEPSTTGGELRVGNAANALDRLKATLPKFLLNELIRPIPRDVLENGAGKGTTDLLTALSRTPELLKARIAHNAFPIFDEAIADGSERLRFRYMRSWIESGHAKSGQALSPLLRVAMDMLDDALDESQIWEGRLQPGEMFFCNNMLVAHARRSFTDEAGDAPRHQVRVWLQIQKT